MFRAVMFSTTTLLLCSFCFGQEGGVTVFATDGQSQTVNPEFGFPAGTTPLTDLPAASKTKTIYPLAQADTTPKLAPLGAEEIKANQALAAAAMKVSGNVGVAWETQVELGLTISDQLRIVRALYKEGWVTDRTSQSGLAIMIMDRAWMEARASAVEESARTGQKVVCAWDQVNSNGVPRLDFNAILAFIQALLPIILQILSIFGL